MKIKKKIALITIIICVIGIFSFIKYTEFDKSKIIITFYVANKDATDFDTYQKRIDNNLIEIIQELINNKKSGIPTGTKLLGIDVKDTIAYINLNSIYASDTASNSSTGSLFKIGSIKNTLLNNKSLNIDKVCFLIEGEQVNLIGPNVVND